MRASHETSGPSVPEERKQAVASGSSSKPPSSITRARCEVEARKASSVSAYQSVREAQMSLSSSTLSASHLARA